MSAHSGSVVTENLYVYGAHVGGVDEADRIVTVVFLPHEHTSADIVRPALTEFLDRDPSGHEVWVVCHEPHRVQLDRILADDALRDRCDGRALRGLVITADGSWDPSDQDADRLWIKADPPTVDTVIAAGLRHQFCDSKALLTAHGQFHFGKPGGAHSKTFLRAQPAVARDAHAHFVAAALLRHLEIEHVRRVWIDTAGIASVAGALGAVRAAHFTGAPQLLVDSFGGYDGFSNVSPSMAESDAVIISSSTSGSLASQIQKETSVPARQIATLYFVAGLRAESEELTPAPPGIVCDLTRRGVVRDQSYVEPFVTYKNGFCLLCDNNEPAVPLEGDGFLPVTGSVTARSILAIDGSDSLSAFVGLAMPHGALRVRHATHGNRMRTISTAVTPLLLSRAFQEKLDELLNHLRHHPKGRPPIDHVLHLMGDESLALARDLHRRLTGARADPESVDEGIAALKTGGTELPHHVLIVCAVASSGRTLLDISRRLRFLPETTSISYLIAVAHPESEYSWGLTTSNLSKRSAGLDNGFAEGWRIYREVVASTPDTRPLKNPGYGRTTDRRWSSSDPWDKEAAVIEELLARPYQDEAYGKFLVERSAELSGMPGQDSAKRLFLGSGIGVAADGLPPLNSKFVFWDFEWKRDEATEELVYWTITSVLQRNRWSPRMPKAGQYLHVSTGGHFFVIEPMMFDRFNDPVIQASILRASASGELDYTTDATRSRFMRELILDAARNAQSERGAAINEFLLSLAMGMFAQDGRHLRLKPAERQGLVSDLRDIKLPWLSTELIDLIARDPETQPAPPVDDLDEPF